MKKLAVLLAVLAMAGCATTQPPEGMKSTSPLEAGVVVTDSMEANVKRMINSFGFGCETVTNIGDLKKLKESILSMRAECNEMRQYEIIATEDGKWYKVVPTIYSVGESLEKGFQRIIYGNGFKCSAVTDFYEIKKATIYKVDCPEGSYKVTKDGGRIIDVNPW